MTAQAERADVVEVAFTAALCYGHNVIRIPQRSPAHPFQAPVDEKRAPACASGSLERSKRLHSVEAAENAYPLVTKKDLLPQIAGVRP
jgi:hypothetical protein